MENTPAIGPAEESDMFRKLAAVLLIALALATLAVYARAVMAPLTLSIGSGSVALVQKTATVIAPGGVNQMSVTLPAASTAGTTLVLVAGEASGISAYSISGMPAGWTKLAGAVETIGGEAEVWAYVNQPGGIQAITFTIGSGAFAIWNAHLSEWSNVASASSLEASGTATATGGTTLTPATTTAVLTAGDLALAVWVQGLAAPGTPTFTSPSGWTRLIDNGATSSQVHLDAEYRIGPPTGAVVAPVLTSTGTTSTASGVVVVLKAAPPVTDQTAFVAY